MSLNETLVRAVTFEQFQANVRRSLQMPSPIKELFHTMYGIISLLGVAGNALVVFVVMRNPTMRTPRNTLILNLSLANLLISVCLVPFLSIPNVNIEWTYGNGACTLTMLFFELVYYAISFTICAISVDRYLIIKNSGTEQVRIEKQKHALVVVAGIWTIALLVSLPHAPYFENSAFSAGPAYGNRTLLHACRLKAPVSLYTVFLVQLLILDYALPLFFVAVCNYKLHVFLTHRNRTRQKLLKPHRKSSKSFRRSHQLNSLSVARSASPCAVAPATSAEDGEVSNRSVSTDSRKQRKMTRTSGLLLWMAVSYATLWAPHVGAKFMEVLGKEEWKKRPEIWRYVDHTLNMFGTLCVGVNPTLYGYFNANFRQAFRDLFCRKDRKKKASLRDQEQNNHLQPPIAAQAKIGLLSACSTPRSNHSSTHGDLFSPMNDVYL